MAFTIPKIKRKPRRPGRHALSAPPAPEPYRPSVVPGVNRGHRPQRRSEEARYRGEHTAGKHARPRPQARPKDPFGATGSSLPTYRPPAPPRVPVIGQPQPGTAQARHGRQRTNGGPRARFGPPDRVTDLAPAYRAAGVRARTPEEDRHRKARDADFEAEHRARAKAKRDREISRADHEPAPKPRPKSTAGTVYTSAAARAKGRAKAPARPLPGDNADQAARAGARAQGRKGSERDPKPSGGGHPFFSGGNRAAPQAAGWRGSDAT